MSTIASPAARRTERLVRDEFYRRYDESGFHVQLIDGQVYQMSPAGPRHRSAVTRLRRLLERQLSADDFTVHQVAAVELGANSDAEPDLTVVRGPESTFHDRHPTSADVALLIEMSDSTLRHDREVKVPLYAASGLNEVWIVNLVDRQIEIYRNPDAAAKTYPAPQILKYGSLPVPVALPSVSLRLEDVLPDFCAHPSVPQPLAFAASRFVAQQASGTSDFRNPK